MSDRDEATVYSTIPDIIYGTAWKKERTTELVIEAYRAGFRGFDTACQPRHYAEPLVGDAFKLLAAQGVKRSDYYLQTKYTPPSGQDAETIPYDSQAPISAQVAQSFVVSLNNLQTDYLDSLILHTPFADAEETLEAWRAMEAIYNQKGAHRLGISNCYDLEALKYLYQEASIKPRILQNRFYQEAGYDVAIRRWCQEQDITYQSFWTLTANLHLLKHPLVQFLARKYSKTLPQTLFTYVHQRGMVPLTGTTSEQHMQEDLASFSRLMTADELRQIDELLEPTDN